MKNWKKRFISLLLTIVMCLTLGIPALAAEEPVTESSELESQYESVLLAMSGGNVEYLENGETVIPFAIPRERPKRPHAPSSMMEALLMCVKAGTEEALYP